MKLSTSSILLSLLLATGATNASADQFWTWGQDSSHPALVSGVAVAATVNFAVQADAISGFDLVITLVNNSTTLPTSTAEILDGLYFDLSSGPASAISVYSATANLGLLDSGSAQSAPTAGTAGKNICAPGVGTGSTTGSTGQPTAPNATNCTVAGGWEVAYNSVSLGGGASATQHYGIGTTGQGGVFNGNSGNAGAFDYGIAPQVGVNPALGGGLSNAYPHGYTYKQATVILRGFSTSNIIVTNVAGAYGTAPEGTPAATSVITASPEPSALSLVMGGCLLLALGRRREK